MTMTIGTGFAPVEVRARWRTDSGFDCFIGERAETEHNAKEPLALIGLPIPEGSDALEVRAKLEGIASLLDAHRKVAAKIKGRYALLPLALPDDVTEPGDVAAHLEDAQATLDLARAWRAATSKALMFTRAARRCLESLTAEPEFQKLAPQFHERACDALDAVKVCLDAFGGGEEPGRG